MTIKNISTWTFALAALLYLLCACQKDEDALNDYDLFGRLQSGSGTWILVERQTFQNDVPNPTITTTIPDEDIVSHFFIRSIEISGILIDVATVAIYSDTTLTALYDCEAEKERVVYRDGEIFGGTVFTVEKNTAKKQVWNYTIGNQTTRMTFKKCTCDIPHIGSVENGG